MDNPMQAGMQADPEAMFTGVLAGYAGKLIWADEAGPPAADQLGDPVFFETLLGRFHTLHPGADRRALISFWSQYYFNALAIPALVVSLHPGQALGLDFHKVSISFCGQGGTPLVFHMSQQSDGSATDLTGRLAALADQHIAPLITILRRYSGLSERLFWENMAGYLLWAAKEIAITHPDHAPAIRQALADTSWPGRRCAGLEPMKRLALQGETLTRKVCCLRYKLPGFCRCAGLCPLRDLDKAGN